MLLLGIININKNHLLNTLYEINKFSVKGEIISKKDCIPIIYFGIIRLIIFFKPKSLKHIV